MKKLQGWRVGHFHGVDVQVHFSLAFLLFYVVLVAGAQFPLVVRQSGVDPALLGGSPGIWSVVLAFGLFASVLFHEFAHVLVAQSMGVRVESVTLMMLGGVSQMEKLPTKPFAEFKVSIVGPLASFFLAGGLFLIKGWIGSPSIDFFCYWLGRLNLALGVFNLIPALPLDGGRAFRSILAQWIGADKGTQLAVTTAKTLAWVLGFAGLISFNFILILISIFIYGAAHRELVVTQQERLLRGIQIKDVAFKTEPLLDTELVISAAEKMWSTRRRVLPVCPAFRNISQGTPKLSGVITLEQVLRIPQSEWTKVRLKQIVQEASGNVVDSNDLLTPHLNELGPGGFLVLSEENTVIGTVENRDLAELMEFKLLDDFFKSRLSRAA